jgi:hypothetical protein
MRISGIPFGTTDWSSIQPTTNPGDSARTAKGARLFIVD